LYGACHITIFSPLPFAIAAAICLGSFGVPVKSEVVKRLDVDPLVVQVSQCLAYHLQIIFRSLNKYYYGS
jgi:hypothetical protein